MNSLKVLECRSKSARRIALTQQLPFHPNSESCSGDVCCGGIVTTFLWPSSKMLREETSFGLYEMWRLLISAAQMVRMSLLWTGIGSGKQREREKHWYVRDTRSYNDASPKVWLRPHLKSFERMNFVRKLTNEYFEYLVSLTRRMQDKTWRLSWTFVTLSRETTGSRSLY